jgi:hypothetical protein
MEKIKIKEIFKDCGRLIWANPFTWFLGLFAALFVNNEINLIIINFKKINNWINQLIFLNSFQLKVSDLFKNFLVNLNFKENPFLIVYIFIALCFFYLAFHSQIALILFLKNKKYSFKKIWRKSTSYIFPVFLVYFFSLIILYGFLFLLSFPFFQNLPLSILFYIIIFIFLILFVSLISRFTVISLILEKKNILKAIKSSLFFLIHNFLIIIKTIIYINLIIIILGIIFFIVSLGILFPVLFLINLFLNINFIFGFWLITSLATLFIICLLLFTGSLFSAWQIMIWAMIFKKNKKE